MPPPPPPPLKQKEKDLSKVLSNVVGLMPHSYSEQSKRHLTYLVDIEHIKIDYKKSDVIIHGKNYNLIDLVSDLIANR